MPARPCRAVEDGMPCPSPAEYRALLVACPPCRDKFGSACRGHGFCGWHAAAVGLGLEEHEVGVPEGGPLIEVARMVATTT